MLVPFCGLPVCPARCLGLLVLGLAGSFSFLFIYLLILFCFYFSWTSQSSLSGLDSISTFPFPSPCCFFCLSLDPSLWSYLHLYSLASSRHNPPCFSSITSSSLNYLLPLHIIKASRISSTSLLHQTKACFFVSRYCKTNLPRCLPLSRSANFYNSLDFFCYSSNPNWPAIECFSNQKLQLRLRLLSNRFFTDTRPVHHPCLPTLEHLPSSLAPTFLALYPKLKPTDHKHTLARSVPHSQTRVCQYLSFFPRSQPT